MSKTAEMCKDAKNIQERKVDLNKNWNISTPIFSQG